MNYRSERGEVDVVSLIFFCALIVLAAMWGFMNATSAPVPVETTETPPAVSIPDEPSVEPRPLPDDALSTKIIPEEDMVAWGDADFIAKSVVTIFERIDFFLYDFPDVKFKFNKIRLGKGGVSIPYCGSGAEFMSIEYYISPSYLKPEEKELVKKCIHVGGSGSSSSTVLYFKVETNNSSSEKVAGYFTVLTYKTMINGETKRVKMTPYLDSPSMGSYAFSSSETDLAFIIPPGVDEVDILYGSYYQGEALASVLKKTRGAFRVNLLNGFVSAIPYPYQ